MGRVKGLKGLLGAFRGWNVNVLSGARFFLFGARDVWFEVPAPIFLRGPWGGLTHHRALYGRVYCRLRPISDMDNAAL